MLCLPGTAHTAGQTQLSPEVAERLVAGVSDGVEPLTARELEVLTLVGHGQSNAQVAAGLNILGKLRASNRTEAVTTALRRGLIALSYRK